MKIGFIGLGAMGRPMAKNLAKNNIDISVFDISQDAVEDLKSVGATACVSVAEMAKNVDIVITMLPNAKIVDSSLTSFYKNAREGQIVVDMSTVATSSTLAFAEKMKTKGLQYVDAPVSGGFKGAENGTLTIMVGGQQAPVDKVMPLLEIMGEKIYHVGDVGAGDSMKLVNNLLLGCNMAAIAEALALGVKSGLNLDTMCEIIQVSSGASYAFNAKVPTFIKDRNFNPGFAIDLQYKDLELAIETAKSQNLPMPLTTLTQQIFEMARASDLGKEDISAVIKVWENLMEKTIE